MAGREFDIIRRFFSRPELTMAGNYRDYLKLGPGDDCAIMQVPGNNELAVSMDLLVCGIHFPENADPTMIAQRCLRVNLSDLAAMGAIPAAFTLGLVLPEVDEQWLEHFSKGLAEVAGYYGCPLAGGDLTAGPLSIAIQVHGIIEAGQAILRSNACAGDLLYVSGELGASGLAVKMIDREIECSPADVIKLNLSYYMPEPQLELAHAGRELISSAIDISDGLLADVGHLAVSSGVKIEINSDKVPLASTLHKYLDANEALVMGLSAGDDYQLAMTVPADKAHAFEELASKLDKKVSLVGRVLDGEGVICLDEQGGEMQFDYQGYQHF